MEHEGVLQGWVGAFGEGGLGSRDGRCRWYGGFFPEEVRGRSGWTVRGVGVEGVEGVVEYFEELFTIWVVFLDLGSNGNWVRIWWWCVFEVGLGFLIF